MDKTANGIATRAIALPVTEETSLARSSRKLRLRSGPRSTFKAPPAEFRAWVLGIDGAVAALLA
jgi:hypothetical protein